MKCSKNLSGRFVLLFLVILIVTLGLATVTTAVSAQTADITVNASGGGDYTSIQNAVDNATTNDNIKVESGTYEQHTEISKNITVYAPNGATIANTSAVSSKYTSAEARSGFQLSGQANTTISGFTLDDWQWGISAGGSEGEWTAKDLTINNGSCSVCAATTPGDWTLENVDINNGDPAISAYDSSGDWQVTNTTIEGDISATKSSGHPSLTNTTIVGADQGIDFGDAVGSLSVSESSITDSKWSGIEAENVSGDVEVVDTTIQDSDTGIDFELESSGDLRIKSTVIQNITYTAVDAENATGNINTTDTTLSEADMGIDLEDSTGNLSVDATSMQNITYDAIQAENTSGILNIQNIDAQTANVGIDGVRSTGSATITNVTIDNTEYDSIAATNATGAWTIKESVLTGANGSSNSVDLVNSEGKWQINESELLDGADASNAGLQANASYNYWGATDGPSGDFNGSGAPAVGNISVSPAYTDSTLSSTTTVSNESGPVVDTAASSITPDAISPGASQEYRVNVTINATNSLTDESGEVDVLFENFSLDTGETDLTINYTQSDISNGTLNVTKRVNATAPSTTGDYAVTVTDLRRENNDGSTDYLIEDENITVANITVVELTWAGNGTPTDPYIITNVSELQDMKYLLDAHYKLGNDIDASETSTWNDGKGFDPVGGTALYGGEPFTGSLRGADHAVIGLEINRSNKPGVGLFGGIGESESTNDGVVENLSLNNVNVSGGSDNVGGLVGVADAPINTVRITGSVNGSKDRTGGIVGYLRTGSIKNASTDVSVNGNNKVGGLVGRSGGNISRASSTGSVNGDNQVGGLVGYAWAPINDTMSTSTVTGTDEVGGLVGYIGSNKINTSYAAGTVTGSSNVGGLVGRVVNLGGDAINSYWDEEATAQSTSAGSATGLTTSEMTGIEAKTSMSGLDFDTTWDTQGNDYPKLAWQEAPTESDSTELTGTDLQTLAGTNATFEFALENTGDQNSSYILNLTVPDNWTPVAYSDDGGDRQDGEVKWLWQTIEPNETVTPSVTVEVPERINGSYTVTGEALTNESVVAEATATATVLNRNVTASIVDQTIANGSETSVTVDAPLSNGTFVNVTENATFSSNDTAVATVNENGTVTATGTGTAIINATYEGQKDFVTVTVTPADVDQAIDADNDGEIDDVEILTAIDYWEQSTAVPRTDGKRIGDFEILDLIAKWRYNTQL